MCRLGVLAYLDVPLGSVGSILSKVTLLRLPESVNKQTDKQTNKWRTTPKEEWSDWVEAETRGANCGEG